MPAYSWEIRSHARRLWESGNRPQEVRQSIRDRYSIKLSEATLRRWANDDSWSDWKTARQERASSFEGTRDPAVHLCEVLARRAVREHSQIRRYESLTRDDAILITKDVLEHVIYNYEPDPIIISHLRGMILDYIYAYRNDLNGVDQGDFQQEPHIDGHDVAISKSPPSSVINVATPDTPEHYDAIVIEGHRVLKEIESKLVEVDQRLEQMKSMIRVFDQLEQRIIGFTQETSTVERDTNPIPDEYSTPSDDQIIQIYEEEERLQKLLEIWDENEEDTGNWTDKPWLDNP